MGTHRPVYESLNKPVQILVTVSPTGSCCLLSTSAVHLQIAAQRITQVTTQEQTVTSREREASNTFPQKKSVFTKSNF